MSDKELKPCPLCGGSGIQTDFGISCDEDACPMWSALLARTAWQGLPRTSDALPLVEALETIELLDSNPGAEGDCAEHARAALTPSRGTPICLAH